MGEQEALTANAWQGFKVTEQGQKGRASDRPQELHKACSRFNVPNERTAWGESQNAQCWGSKEPPHLVSHPIHTVCM